MNNVIYIGSTNMDNVFHVGMTGNNRSPLDRWRDGDYRGKLPYLPGKVEFYHVGDLRDEPIHSYIVKDKCVTNLHDEGISSDEIFRVDSDNPVEYITNLVEEAIKYNQTGVRPVDKFFSPRPHQTSVNDQILSRWTGEETVIQPLNLCARFGKTLGGLDLFKRSGLDVMIVASYWLSANQSFINTIESKFDITSDITVIKPDYDQFKDAISKGNRVLIDVSLHQDSDKVDERLVSALNVYKSLIYIDEADFGAWTKSSRDTANQFINSGINLVCVATGTNIDRALIGSRSDIQQPITVSYIDLIEAKPDYDCLSDIVEVSCVSLDANPLLIDELNQLSEENCPNMAKIFSRRNDHLGRSILGSLVDSDRGDDVFSLYSTEYGSIEHPAVMMFIPGGKADVNNLVKIGKSMSPHYNWIALHGDNNTNRDAEDEVLNTIQNGGGERTVIISCGMGARSFSVPNIISVINCKDGGSMGAAVQQASRAFTPGCDKTHGLIVNYSFNPERVSTFESDLIASAMSYEDRDTESSLRRVWGLVNFMRRDEYGYLVKLTDSEFNSYVCSTDNLKNIASAVVDYGQLITNEQLLDILSNVDTKSMTKEWTGAINKAKTYIETTREGGEVDPDNKTMKELINRIKTVIDTTGNVHYLAPYGSSYQECMETIATDIDKNQEYINLVGVSAGVVLDNLIDHLPTQVMDLIVTQVKTDTTYNHYAPVGATHMSGLFNDLVTV